MIEDEIRSRKGKNLMDIILLIEDRKDSIIFGKKHDTYCLIIQKDSDVTHIEDKDIHRFDTLIMNEIVEHYKSITYFNRDLLKGGDINERRNDIFN